MPFAALRLDDSALIDRHDIFVLPALVALPTLIGERKAWNSNIAVFAQPGPPAHFYLAGAKSEAEAIARLFHSTADTDASDSSFREKGPLARIIHIAAHADVDSEHQAASKILMNNSAGEGGFLYLNDIHGMEFPHADLVALSACETLNGPVRSGDNLLAFNTAFLKAGAPSVVASLWKVDDAATQYLMTEFYKQLLGGVPKAKALRFAQLATRKQYPDPHDWAAFELTGDPGPIQATSFDQAILTPTL